MDLNPASPLWNLEGQSFLTVPLSFSHFIALSQQLVPLLLSLRPCVFFFSFKFQLSTFNFPPLPARVQ